jgi:hypothetical protein
MAHCKPSTLDITDYCQWDKSTPVMLEDTFHRLGHKKLLNMEINILQNEQVKSKMEQGPSSEYKIRWRKSNAGR